MEKLPEGLREKILIVQKAFSSFQTTADLLSHWGYATAVTEQNARMKNKVAQESPELILFDKVGFDTASSELCCELKSDRFVFHIPIIVLGTCGFPDSVHWLDSGADLCLDFRIAPVELVARIHALLRRTVKHDPLTPLLTGAYFQRQLDARLAGNISTAILYIHIDHFQAYIDAYGLATAEPVISRVGKLIEEALPTGNSSGGRLTGEDFMAYLAPEFAPTAADTLINRFREVRQEFYSVEGLGASAPRMTLSIALATNEHQALLNYVQASQLLALLMQEVQAGGGDHWERSDS